MEPGVLNLTYEQIEKWKNENNEWVLPESFNIKNGNNQIVATVNPQTAAINNNEFVWAKEGTQQNPITLQYNETDGYYVQSTFDYPTKNVKIKQIDTSIIPSGGDPPITIDNVVLTKNGQYLPSDFDPTTGQLLPEGQTSNAEYFTSVEVATNPLPLDPNQPPLTSNGQYTIYDKDADDDMDIVESNQQQPQVQQRKLIMTRDVIDDQSYKNIGTFTVNVTPTPPITVNAIIEDNGTYSPNQFDTTTGELLPTGQTSNAQYINQVTVNNTSGTSKLQINKLGKYPYYYSWSDFTLAATNVDVNVYYSLVNSSSRHYGCLIKIKEYSEYFEVTFWAVSNPKGYQNVTSTKTVNAGEWYLTNSDNDKFFDGFDYMFNDNHIIRAYSGYTRSDSGIYGTGTQGEVYQVFRHEIFKNSFDLVGLPQPSN